MNIIYNGPYISVAVLVKLETKEQHNRVKISATCKNIQNAKDCQQNVLKA